MKALVTCLALWFTAFLACASGEKVCLIKINGAIAPATASYISRSIGEAQSQNAQCLIIQLNAAGGKVFVELERGERHAGRAGEACGGFRRVRIDAESKAKDIRRTN